MNGFEKLFNYARRGVLPLGILAVCVSSPSLWAQQKAPATPDLVRNIDEPGFNSYQSWKSLVIDHAFTTNDFFTIPANKLLVVEHVSVSGDSDIGPGPVSVTLTCANGSSSFANHYLVLTPQFNITSQGSTRYVATQPLKCYATGTGLQVHVFASAINTIRVWNVSVSGYLVPE